MGETPTTAVMAPEGTRGSRLAIRAIAVAALTVVTLFVYDFWSTWGGSMTYGGQSQDGGWLDVHGDPTGVPPTTITVTGHPSGVIEALVVAIGVAAVVLPVLLRRAGRPRAGTITTAVAIAAIPMLAAAAVVVFAVVPGAQMRQAFRDEVTPPPMPPTVTVHVSTPA
jgi:hypothetical protein